MQHAATIMVLGGAHPAMDARPLIPRPSKLDLGDTKPGDKLEIIVQCELSEDGKHFEVIKVEGVEPDDDDAGAAETPEETSGDRWQKMKDRMSQSEED
jgi:hypothetical protein